LIARWLRVIGNGHSLTITCGIADLFNSLIPDEAANHGTVDPPSTVRAWPTT
jgi:hypothetical protein